MFENLDLKTINDYINWACDAFIEHGLYYGHGTCDEYDEAIYVIFSALDLYQALEEPLTEEILNKPLSSEDKSKIEHLLQQRIVTRKPLAYLTNRALYAGLEFYVDERVLIPRSPLFEFIFDGFMPWVKDVDTVERILDIGTGSGCLAILCAYAFPNAIIDAVDIDLNALEVAKINVTKHGLESRINLIASDLFSNVPKNVKYDAIISNPPYVMQEEMNDLPQEYTFEPQSALVAGSDGLLYVDKLLREAKNYIKDKGILVVEVGNSCENLVEKYPHLDFVWLEFMCGESEVFLLEL